MAYITTVFSKLLVLFLALYGGQTANSGAGNMNGKYLVASGGRQAVPYNDDYASKNYKYFDVWSPEIATHYGEVFWTDQGNNPIPQEIIDTFKGKVMAIVGYEQDQVMVSPVGQPGVNPDKDVSVPINWAYNHHYMAWMTGAHSKLVKIAHPNPMDVSAHGYHMRWEAIPKEAPFQRVSPEIPISQMFSEGNGGESRKSYHGYPTGYAQLIDSPDMWHITPMQIDTRNRDCGATPDDIHKCTTFTPGPEPKQARYGLGIPENPMYSGLLECPCNSRFGGDPHIYGPDTKTKSIKHHFTLVAQSTCGESAINSADDCFYSAAHIGIIASKNVTLSAASDKVPKGCSVMIESDSTTTVTYNKFNSLAACSSSTNRGGSTSFNKINVTLSLQLTSTMVTITITGPAGAWFGVGFNATQMADSPYAIITNSTSVYERQIGTCGSEGEHCPGDALPSTLTVVSNKVENNMRTVVLTRGLKGNTSKYYTFDVTKQSQISMIAAVGVGEKFAYHKAHDTSTITLMAQGEANCICDIGMEGVLCYNNGSNCNSFVKNCVPAPAGELLTQKNPTCNSVQYAGGLSCCGHRRIMLDADQEIRPELLRYHMKFRFWYQEYTNNNGKVSHHNLDRIYYQTEAWAGEYDIPPAFAKPGKPIPGYPDWPVSTPTPGTTCTGNCPDGDDCECEHMIVFKWELSNTRLIYAGGHCHAPSCISMKLYRNDTGHKMELLCEQVPVIGKGNVHHDKYDEAGYIALPPCLWGDDEGLDPAVLLPPNTPMVSIKLNRNTHMGHFGEMASWQMRGVNF